MKITYIHHSSFFVELETMALLFDYTEGILPEINKDKPLFVFASHRHGDHYSPKILDLPEKYDTIHFILSDDIPITHLPEPIVNHVTYMKPGEERAYSLKEGMISHLANKGREADIEVSTFRSTDEGVAFIIKTEGKILYHAGDLNNWHWEGEPDDWNQNMAKQYSEEVDKMKGIKFDVAFLPLDPRQDNAFYLGFHEFMSKHQVNRVFPMHCWGDFSVIQKLKNMEVSNSYEDRIIDVKEDGESFIIR
jgi:L-ascorbate metabolism protein UlaG (beta-lactamase superfamily)